MASGHVILQHPAPLCFLRNPPDSEWFAPTSPGPFLYPLYFKAFVPLNQLPDTPII